MRCAFACLGLVAVAATATHAQPAPDARSLEAEGLAAGQRGDYDAAIAAFTRAFELDPQPRYRCNLGSAHYGKSDYQRAQLYLGWCLERIAAAPEGMARVAGFVEGKLREAGMVKVRITTRPAGAEVKLAGLGTLAAPVAVFLAPGEHAIAARRDGYREAKERFTLVAGQDRNVRVELEAETGAAGAGAGTEAGTGAGTGAEAGSEAGTEAGTGIEAGAGTGAGTEIETETGDEVGVGGEVVVESRWRRVPPYIAGGVAVAALAAGIGFRLHAQSIVDDQIVGMSLAGDAYDRARDDALRNNRIAIAGFVTAGVAAALCAYLFSRPEKRGRLKVGAAPTRGGARVGISLSL